MEEPAAGDTAVAASLFMSHTVVAMRRAHGIVLLAAWCLLAPVAISLMALSRNNARLRSRAFLPHAAIQVSVLLLTCVGLGLGLLLPVTGRTPHKCVGYLTLALAAFPLTAALWRPGPGGAARRLWAGCDRACGLAAVTAAFVDGYLGVRRTGMQPRCVPAAIMGAGLAVLTCTYGFKLFEAAAVVLRKRGVKGEGGEGHHGGDVEKTPAALPSKGSASLEEDDKYGICAVASASELSPKKLCGDPGFGSRRGGGRGRDNKGRGGGKEEAEEEEEKKRKDKSDSFDSAAGCCGRDNEP